jgi:hypothetical protein
MVVDDKTDDMPIQSSNSEQSQEYVENYLHEKQQALAALGEGVDELEKVCLQLDIAEALVGVSRDDEAWELARTAFDVFLSLKRWEDAVKCCDVLYQSGQPASLVALGQGVWLAVTYPVDPQLSINMLSYVVDETPAKADGAAIAAVTAHYIADIRTDGKQHENMTFLTKEMLADVARKHSDVKDQSAFSAWMDKLKLNDPDDFLPKLSLVVGAIVPSDQWWFDRDQLRSELPD